MWTRHTPYLWRHLETLTPQYKSNTRTSHKVLRRTTTYYNVLQRTPTHYNVLHRTTTVNKLACNINLWAKKDQILWYARFVEHTVMIFFLFHTATTSNSSFIHPLTQGKVLWDAVRWINVPSIHEKKSQALGPETCEILIPMFCSHDKKSLPECACGMHLIDFWHQTTNTKKNTYTTKLLFSKQHNNIKENTGAVQQRLDAMKKSQALGSETWEILSPSFFSWL